MPYCTFIVKKTNISYQSHTIIISAHKPDLSNPWSQSARSIPSVPKLKLMASRHQNKNTRTRRRGNLHHGVRKKGLSNYSSTNPLKSKFRRATSDCLDTALLLRCCIHELPAVTIRKMPSRRQCGNGISHAESSQ